MTASPRAAVLALTAVALACTNPDASIARTAASTSAPTGSLSSARSQLTLTALPDGRAVAAGGYGPMQVCCTPGAVAAVEAWNPGTATFGGVMGSLGTPRFGAIAVHLGAGTDLVLVAGGTTGDGISGFSATGAADLFTAHWAMSISGGPVPSMIWPVTQHAGVALGDGRALVCGGSSPGGTTLPLCEVFDPATHTWTQTGSMKQPRRQFTLTLLDGGMVLAAGGVQDGGALAPGAELYDPVSNTWTAIAGAQVGRYGHRAFKLQDGRVILACGAGATSAPMASTLIYQPSVNLVGTIGSLSVARSDCEGTVLPDGRVLVAGGHGFSQATSAVEVLSPSTLAWTSLPPMAVAREQFGLALVADGKVLVAGGSNSGSASLSSAELIDPTCVPTTCGAGACGAVADGCGGTLSCGTCGGGQVCSTAHQCCTPTTCAAAGATCGTVSDGCGGTLSCGTCGAGQSCSTTHQCCSPWTCTPGVCGTFSNGCGFLVYCSCASGQACNASTGTCCAPTTCAAAGATCGTIPDGCGGSLSCGTCAAGQTCTGGACVADPAAATWDAALKAPRCASAGPSCDSGTLLVGRAGAGPEAHAPNTVATAAACADGASGTFHADESLDRLRIASLDGGPLTAGRQARIDATVWAYSGYSSDHLDLYLAPSAASPAWTLVATLTPTGSGAQTLGAVVTLPVGDTQVLRGNFRFGGSSGPCTSGPYDDRDDLVFGVVSPRDITAPTVAITSPAANATVGGVVTVAVAATDDVGVTRVELWNGGVMLAATTSASPTFAWDATAATTGVHTLTARALDAAGNVGTSPAVAVVVVAAQPAPVATASYDAGRKAPACLVRASGCDTGTLVNGRGTKGPEANAPNTLGGSCADGASGTYHSDESLDRLRVVTRSGAALAPGQAVRVEATVWAWGTSDRLDVWYAADASAPAWTLAGTVAPASSGAQTLAVEYVLPAGAVQAIRGTFRYGGSATTCTAGPYDDHDDLVFVTQ
jgi:hypothetical protein